MCGANNYVKTKITKAKQLTKLAKNMHLTHLLYAQIHERGACSPSCTMIGLSTQTSGPQPFCAATSTIPPRDSSV